MLKSIKSWFSSLFKGEQKSVSVESEQDLSGNSMTFHIPLDDTKNGENKINELIELYGKEVDFEEEKLEESIKENEKIINSAKVFGISSPEQEVKEETKSELAETPKPNKRSRSYRKRNGKPKETTSVEVSKETKNSSVKDPKKEEPKKEQPKKEDPKSEKKSNTNRKYRPRKGKSKEETKKAS